ncbi:uncharacterized protein LOC117319390 [Pecten maximus]|uniref:uncharacterized protein LOC117319390 n=1 Tax=Pecten maximus TaxID=6579 RepID=UPI001457F8F7|nr:uncharacterized protein LOC117319390 [Pecten maximus]
MSAPHNDTENPSLNSLIDKEEFSLQYVRLDDAIRMIKELGKGSNPKIFDNLSSTICWIAENNYNIKYLLHLLDDFLVVVPPGEDASKVMQVFLSIFQKLGMPLAVHKIDGPTTCLEYLGICLDLFKMEARLPDVKVKRICGIVVEFSKKKKCSKRELLSLLGHMNFACRVIRPGRSFISHLIKLSTCAKELHHYVTLNAAIRSDLGMWSIFLSSWNGVSFFMDDNITKAADMHLFTDATPSAFGGILGNSWFQGYFPSAILEEDPSMALFELYPIVMACVLWGHSWSRKRILFHCDNLSTVDIISKGRSKVPSIMKLMRRVTFHSATHNYVVHAVHIEGKRNNVADSLSRWQMDRFRALAPTRQPAAYPVPTRS